MSICIVIAELCECMCVMVIACSGAPCKYSGGFVCIDRGVLMFVVGLFYPMGNVIFQKRKFIVDFVFKLTYFIKKGLQNEPWGVTD